MAACAFSTCNLIRAWMLAFMSPSVFGAGGGSSEVLGSWEERNDRLARGGRREFGS